MTDIATPIAKPWYLSKTIISLAAGLIMAVTPKVAQLLGMQLPITPDQANEIALFVIPQAVALYGRLTTSTVLTKGAASAAVLNNAAG